MPISLSGSLNLSGSLTTTGTITATTLVVQTITSSISSITGSTNFGSLLANTHTFTGSLNVTGALAVTTNGTEFQVNSTGVNLGNALTDSHIISGSLTVNPGGLFVSSSGIIGIGTSSPNTKLQVEDGYISTYHNINADGAGYGIQFYTNGGGSKNTIATIDISQVGTARSSNMIFNTSNAGAPAERMRITTSGSVGIGTNSPNANLTVWTPSTTGMQTALRLNNPFGFTNANTGAKIIFSQDRTTAEDYPMGEIGVGQESAGSSSAGYMFFGTRNSSTIIERMRISSAGNVGIGASPVNLLSVRGNADFGATGIAYAGLSQYGALTFPRGQIMWSNTNGQNQLYIVGNAYSNANGVFAYRNSGQPSTAIGLDNGGIAFLTAGNGTADAAISWTSAIGISNAGYVTKPSNPAFRAYYSVNSTWTLASNETFVFNTTEYNIGSCYNTSNGRFTAPVAGVYQFNFYSIVYGAYTNGFINFRKNGAALTSGTNLHFTTTAAATWNNVQFHTSLYLNSGDYVTLQNNDMSVNYHGDDWSSFSGYLVG